MSDKLRERLGWSPVAGSDAIMREAALHRLDALTKPLGALGDLESLAAQICAVQRSLQPVILRPVALVFAADHGVAERGVSAYPSAVTGQMVQNFLKGGAAINVLARLHGIELWIVDAGVVGDCGAHPQLIDAKIRAGTRDFVREPAMTADECRTALERGRQIVEQVVVSPANTLLLGEMGIGNTAAAALLVHGLTRMPLADCVGRGTGLDAAGVERKTAVLAAALARRAAALDAAAATDEFELLREFGGYEIAMLTGAMLAAAQRRLLIVVDGLTVTTAAALAIRIEPRVLDYCVFAHCSAERAHRALLAHLQVRPLLDLGMRLGEGSGAAMALPILRAALALFTQMATFADAGVSEHTA